ncbi:MAG: 3-oxoacyl-ACP synthase [Flavobacteriaceae bacterium]|nr:3-oxoacyl-ACP synthase [Flavobacteriaceae bacterium]
MDKKLYIHNYCKIKNNSVNLNGEIIYSDKETEMTVFLKNVYHFLGLKYAKFFKMDSLSKIAFLTSEILVNNAKITIKETNTAVVLSNNASSLDTDRKHQKSISDPDNYFPSPSVFVYTLPNIGIGEISIRHGLKSENVFFVFSQYNETVHYTYENSLIQSGKATTVLSGWTNVDDQSVDVFMYLISEKGSIPHSAKELIKLYKN